MKTCIHRTALVFSLSLFSLSALAHTYAENPDGQVVRDGSGECVRTPFWTPETATRECDAHLFPQAVAAPAPVPVAAPTPKPAPAPAVAAKPEAVKFELSADHPFDSGKSTLKSEALGTLDKLAAELKGADYAVIHVAGHADRRGSVRGNQKLSEARANAVRDYLVSQGIPSDKIDASGHGSSEPVTGPSDCKGMSGSKLSACLAPDRRVSIHVVGHRMQ